MRVLFLLIIIAFLALISSPCWAGIPFLMNYQGMLTDTGGNPLTGDHNLTFKIYSQSSGGSALWTETHTGTQVQDGLFNVILGSLALLPSSVFEDTVRYLGITVGSDPELSPRIRITSIPYAYRALVADSAAVAGAVVGSAGGWVDDGSAVRLENTTDDVGIGTNNPGRKLHIYNPTSFEVRAESGGGYSFFETYAASGYNSGLKMIEGGSTKAYAYWDAAEGFLSLYESGGHRLVVKEGKIGIGTTAPKDHLHVANHIRIGEDATYPNVYGELIHDGGGTGFKINAHAGGGWADIHLQTDGTTRMFIERLGNVGIGTTSPSEKLDVEGDIDVSYNEVKHYYGFPQADYNSGWVAIPQGTSKTFTHNLGGSYNNYFVDLTLYDNTGSITGPHNQGIGTWNDGTNIRGAYWYDLDNSIIRVRREAHDGQAEWVRVRIWVIR